MENRKIKIVADSSCDLTKEQIKEYDISIVPFCIVLGEQSYLDMEEITPDEIYKWADESKMTPKTAAISIDYAVKTIQKLKEADVDIIFIGISEGVSTTCNVMRLAAQMTGAERVFIVDSQSLSTGIGLQVIKAAKMARAGMSAEEIVKEIEAARSRVKVSFVVDSLNYLARGGRCSDATALLADALKLHPSIRVVNGRMEEGTKYKGSLSKAVMQYLDDMKSEMLAAEEDLMFIIHSGIDEEILVEAKAYVENLNYFKEVVVTRAGGVISSHCGPATFSIMYYAK